MYNTYLSNLGRNCARVRHRAGIRPGAFGPNSEAMRREREGEREGRREPVEKKTLPASDAQHPQRNSVPRARSFKSAENRTGTPSLPRWHSVRSTPSGVRSTASSVCTTECNALPSARWYYFASGLLPGQGGRPMNQGAMDPPPARRVGARTASAWPHHFSCLRSLEAR